MNKAQKIFFDVYKNPIWVKYECEKGARWTSVKGGTCEHKHGEQCNFSGCEKGHYVNIKGETSDRDEAHEWFKRPEGRDEDDQM